MAYGGNKIEASAGILHLCILHKYIKMNALQLTGQLKSFLNWYLFG